MPGTDVEVWLDDNLLMTYRIGLGGYLATEHGMKREALVCAIEDGFVTRRDAERAVLICKAA